MQEFFSVCLIIFRNYLRLRVADVENFSSILDVWGRKKLWGRINPHFGLGVLQLHLRQKILYTAGESVISVHVSMKISVRKKMQKSQEHFIMAALHRVHEKTAPLYTLPYLWQTTSDFNESLRQHWNVKLQTSHQISAKSVNICNSYSKFSKVTQKHKCPQAQAWLTVKCASVRMARRQHGSR